MRSKQTKMTTEQRLEAMEMLAAGIKTRVITEKYGVSRHYISLLSIAYKKNGPDAIVDRSSGPRPLIAFSAEQEAKLVSLVNSTLKPSTLGLPLGKNKPDTWTPSLVLKLAKQHVYFVPQLVQIRELLEKNSIYLTPSHTREDLQFSPDFYEYINSPIGKQVRERELIAAAKWEEERELIRKKRAASVEQAASTHQATQTTKQTQALGKHAGGRRPAQTPSKKKRRK